MASELQDSPRGNQYRVKLVSVWSPHSRVEFNITPAFSENRSVEYTPLTPIHMPGSIMIYKNTQSRTFSIGAKLVSRNRSDVAKNMFYLQTLRSWTLPYFGQSKTDSLETTRARSQTSQLQQKLQPQEQFRTNSRSIQTGNQQDTNISTTRRQLDNTNRNTGVDVLGAPPDVLYLYAYSTGAHDERGRGFVNINRVPVVLTSLGISYPDDVDYIPNLGNNEPFPVRMEVTLELTETHSPREFEQFSLFDFKFGNLKNF